MTVNDIETIVLDIVQDPSFEGKVLPFINECLLSLAGKYKLETLDTENDIECLENTNHVPLPDDYLHGLYSVRDEEGVIGTPSFYDNFARFNRIHADLTKIGRIFDVARRGVNLYYTNREDKTLTLRYFSKPTKLVRSKDIPVILPEHLHEPILVNYAASKIFSLIEDGVEDPKTNTKVYYSLYLGGIADLPMYTINTDTPEYVQDEYEGVM